MLYLVSFVFQIISSAICRFSGAKIVNIRKLLKKSAIDYQPLTHFNSEKLKELNHVTN